MEGLKLKITWQLHGHLVNLDVYDDNHFRNYVSDHVWQVVEQGMDLDCHSLFHTNCWMWNVGRGIST